jgi:hypothetical protein
VDLAPVMMVPMPTPPQDPEQAPQPAETVVEFGPEQDEPRAGRRRFSLTELAVGLAADRRAVPLAAAVGAVALFASLISEWQVTQVNGDSFIGGAAAGGNRPMPSGVTDLGALGGAYLGGLFVLTGAMVLVLYGPPAGRRYARLLGLSGGGVLLALLAALASSLSDTSRVIFTFLTTDFAEDQMQLSYGRGLWCAFFGVAAVLLALYLSGRHEPRTVVTATSTEDAVVVETPEAPVVWSWRRPREDEETLPDAPYDLTVTSTKPFTSRPDDRDKPN